MPSETERMLRGDLYDPTDPDLVADRERARELQARYNRTAATETERRRGLLDTLLGDAGDEPRVEPPFRCDYGYNVHLGGRFYANYGCVVLDAREVRFRAGCLLGPGVHLYAATHPVDPETRAEGLEYGEPITIGENVWIGGRAVVTPGVTIGNDAVVGAGSVVTDDVPAETVVGGNPARVIERP